MEGEAELRKYISHYLLGKIVDPFAWREMTDSTGKITRLVNNPALFTKDPELLNEFSFKIVTLMGTMAATNRVVITTMKSADNLIKLLKKEYHMD